MAETTLFAFQEGAERSAGQIVNDGVMGGLSSGSFQILPNSGAVFSGIVSLDNGGGFTSARSPSVWQDLSSFDSFVLRARGDGHRFKFNMRTDPAFDKLVYQCVFETTRGMWTEQRLAFAQFAPTFRGRVLSDVPALNPGRIASVGFLIADRQGGPFRLEIGWIKASGRDNE
jgi:hypothetical protein